MIIFKVISINIFFLFLLGIDNLFTYLKIKNNDNLFETYTFIFLYLLLIIYLFTFMLRVFKLHLRRIELSIILNLFLIIIVNSIFLVYFNSLISPVINPVLMILVLLTPSLLLILVCLFLTLKKLLKTLNDDDMSKID